MFVTAPNRLVVNGASVLGGEAIARLATAGIALVVARYFGAEALGNYGYTLAIASILVIVPDLGLHLFTVREIAASPDRLSEIFWGVHWLKAGLAGAVILFGVLFGEFGIADYERRVLFYILAARVLLQSFSQASMAVFKALERMEFIPLQQFVNTAVVVAWVVVTLRFNGSLPLAVAGLAVGQFAEMCLGWLILSRLRPSPHFLRFDAGMIAAIFRGCFPIGLTTLLLALNLRIDVLVLSRYADSAVLGKFNASAWFLIATFLAASLLMSVLFPRLSRILSTPSVGDSEYVFGLAKNALLLSGLVSLLIWFSAPTLLTTLFGKDFAEAGGTLRILAPAFPLVVLNTSFFYVFAAARRRFVCLITLAVGISLGAVSSILLTSRFGVAGCAAADVIRECIVTALYLCFLIRERRAAKTGSALWRVFGGATAALLVAVSVIRPVKFEPTWCLIWMALVLVASLGLLGLPTSGEWRLLTAERQ